MTFFENIYQSANLSRLAEAKILKTPDEVIDALRKGSDGRRYLETLLNGKKNLPEWFRTLVDTNDTKGIEQLKNVFKKVLDRLADIPGAAINETLCFIIKKAEDISILWYMVESSMDAIVQYATSIKSSWIKDLPSYKALCEEIYNPALWHDFEKEAQDFKAKKNAKKGKNLTNQEKNRLYDTLYEDNTWGLYVPKSFEGDSELASHIKPFNNFTKTRWCTAASDHYFNYYTRDGKNPLYVIKYFENGEYTEAWQLAFIKEGPRIELMDKEDERNYIFLLKNAPKELLMKIVDTSIKGGDKVFPYIISQLEQNPHLVDTLNSGSTFIDDIYATFADEEFIYTISDLNKQFNNIFDNFERLDLYGLFSTGRLKDENLPGILNDIYGSGSNISKKIPLTNVYELCYTSEYAKEILEKVTALVSKKGLYSSLFIKDGLVEGIPFNNDTIMVKSLYGYGSDIFEMLNKCESYPSDKTANENLEILLFCLNINEESIINTYFNNKDQIDVDLLSLIKKGNVKFTKAYLNYQGFLLKNYPLDKALEYKEESGWKNDETLFKYLSLLDKGKVLDLTKIPHIAPEQTYTLVGDEILINMAEDTKNNLIPTGLSPQTYQKYGRDNIINFTKYSQEGAFDDTATIVQYIQYGAQNLNDINILKHQNKLWPSMDIDDCFQLGSQKSIELSKELFNANLPKVITIWEYLASKDELDILRVYGQIKEKLIEKNIDEDFTRSFDNFYDIVERCIKNSLTYYSLSEEDILVGEEYPLDLIKEVAEKIMNLYIENAKETDPFWDKASPDDIIVDVENYVIGDEN